MSLPHGLVEARARRRRYARRWPDLARDGSTRDLIAASGLELLPPGLDLSSGWFVDAGAHLGEWTDAVRLIRPDARVLAVEPHPELAAELERRYATGSTVRVVPAALGDRAGTATLRVTQDPRLSSLREPTDDIVGAYEQKEWWNPAGTFEVAVARLDDLLDGEAVAVLKLDVQGYEREVLAGATDALASAQGVLIEVNFSRYYRGEAGFGELHELLMSQGFVLTAMTNSGALADGRLAWCDACYVRPRAH